MEMDGSNWNHIKVYGSLVKAGRMVERVSLPVDVAVVLDPVLAVLHMYSGAV